MDMDTDRCRYKEFITHFSKISYISILIFILFKLYFDTIFRYVTRIIKNKKIKTKYSKERRKNYKSALKNSPCTS